MKRYPELDQFLSTHVADADPEADAQLVKGWSESASSPLKTKISQQLRLLIDGNELSLEDLGTTSNRWFAEADEAKAWLETLLDGIDGASAQSAGELVVKDSNGAILSEGDSVLVIKDLKVKGGSSDLKRGTLVRKIHLIDDPEVVECRVDGSTLVLKTCFLKKA